MGNGKEPIKQKGRRIISKKHQKGGIRQTKRKHGRREEDRLWEDYELPLIGEREKEEQEKRG